MAGSVWYSHLKTGYFAYHGLFCIHLDLFKYHFILITEIFGAALNCVPELYIVLACPGCDSQGAIINSTHCPSLLEEDQYHTTVNLAHAAKSLLLSNISKDFSLSKDCWKPRVFIPSAIIWPSVLLVNTASLLLVFSLPAKDGLNF